MQWFKRQNTFTKLALGYGLMAILVGVVGYQGNRGLGKVSELGNELHQKHAIPLARLQSANREFDRIFERHLGAMRSDSGECARVYRATRTTIWGTTAAAVVEGRDTMASTPEPEGDREVRPGGAAVAFDLEAALARAQGKRPLLRKMADLFLADCPGMLSQICTALATEDRSMLARAAHRLKGSAANLSAPLVIAAAGRLDAMAREGHLADGDAALEDEVVHLEHALEIFTEQAAACES